MQVPRVETLCIQRQSVNVKKRSDLERSLGMFRLTLTTVCMIVKISNKLSVGYVFNLIIRFHDGKK